MHLCREALQIVMSRFCSLSCRFFEEQSAQTFPRKVATT
jgi:hypothetical protein